MLIPKTETHQSCASILALTLLLSISGPSGTMGIAIANEASIPAAKQDTKHSDWGMFSFLQNFEPPGDGRPENTRGSGTRTGSCSTAMTGLNRSETSASDTERNRSGEGRIRAIVPTDHFGLTLQSHPTVFLDFDGEVAPMVMMRVVSEDETYDERIMLPVDQTQSIQGFSLTRDRPPLEVGKNYKWTLLVACDGQVNPYHPIFSGWVQRVIATATPAELSQQPTKSQVNWYMSGGYWYDGVATLVQTRRATPKDKTAKELWTQLLDIVDKN